MFPGQCWFSGASRSEARASAPRHRFGCFLRKDFAEPAGRGGRTSAQIQLASVAGSCSPGSPGSSGSSQGTQGCCSQAEAEPSARPWAGDRGVARGAPHPRTQPGPTLGRPGSLRSWSLWEWECLGRRRMRSAWPRSCPELDSAAAMLHQGSTAWSGGDNGALPAPGLRPRKGEWVGGGRGELEIASWSSPVPAASPP